MAPASTSTSKQYNSREHVGLLEERVTNVSSTDFPGHYPDEDHSWDLKKFKKVCKIYLYYWPFSLSLGRAQKLQVKIQKLSTRSIEFDLVGVDASIANALRRILIAEVRAFKVSTDSSASLELNPGSDSCNRICIRMEQYFRHGGRGILSPPRIDPLERRPCSARDEIEPDRPGNRQKHDRLQTSNRVHAQYRRAKRQYGSSGPLPQFGGIGEGSSVDTPGRTGRGFFCTPTGTYDPRDRPRQAASGTGD